MTNEQWNRIERLAELRKLGRGQLLQLASILNGERISAIDPKLVTRNTAALLIDELATPAVSRVRFSVRFRLEPRRVFSA